MKVRVINQRSDRWDSVGLAKESAWDSGSLLVPVAMGGEWCMFYRWNLEVC